MSALNESMSGDPPRYKYTGQEIAALKELKAEALITRTIPASICLVTAVKFLRTKGFLKGNTYSKFLQYGGAILVSTTVGQMSYVNKVEHKFSQLDTPLAIALRKVKTGEIPKADLMKAAMEEQELANKSATSTPEIVPRRRRDDSGTDNYVQHQGLEDSFRPSMSGATIRPKNVESNTGGTYRSTTSAPVTVPERRTDNSGTDNYVQHQGLEDSFRPSMSGATIRQKNVESNTGGTYRSTTSAPVTVPQHRTDNSGTDNYVQHQGLEDSFRPSMSGATITRKKEESNTSRSTRKQQDSGSRSTVWDNPPRKYVRKNKYGDVIED